MCCIPTRIRQMLIKKLEKFNYMCGTIKGTLKNETRTETQIKFYKVMAFIAAKTEH